MSNHRYRRDQRESVQLPERWTPGNLMRERVHGEYPRNLRASGVVAGVSIVGRRHHLDGARATAADDGPIAAYLEASTALPDGRGSVASASCGGGSVAKRFLTVA